MNHPGRWRRYNSFVNSGLMFLLHKRNLHKRIVKKIKTESLYTLALQSLEDADIQRCLFIVLGLGCCPDFSQICNE